jgi:hypothetical protein
MFGWAIAFLIIALVAAVGFGGVAGTAFAAAKIIRRGADRSGDHRRARLYEARVKRVSELRGGSQAAACALRSKNSA